MGGTLRDKLPTAQWQVCRHSTVAHCQGEDMGQPPSPGTLLPSVMLHKASPWEGGLRGKTKPAGFRQGRNQRQALHPHRNPLFCTWFLAFMLG